MEWNDMFKQANMPTLEQIGNYINNPFWKDLCNFIETNYNVSPIIEYSTCSLKPGWNVKYRKSNKSICTIYPNENYFTCMVTISSKNQEEIEYILPSCNKYVQEIYGNTTLFNGCRWLMLDVTNAHILKDIKEFISIKMKK